MSGVTTSITCHLNNGSVYYSKIALLLPNALRGVAQPCRLTELKTLYRRWREEQSYYEAIRATWDGYYEGLNWIRPNWEKPYPLWKVPQGLRPTAWHLYHITATERELWSRRCTCERKAKILKNRIERLVWRSALKAHAHDS